MRWTAFRLDTQTYAILAKISLWTWEFNNEAAVSWIPPLFSEGSSGRTELSSRRNYYTNAQIWESIIKIPMRAFQIENYAEEKFESSLLVANLGIYRLHLCWKICIDSWPSRWVPTCFLQGQKNLLPTGSLDTLFRTSTHGRVWLSIVPAQDTRPTRDPPIVTFLRPRKIRPPTNHYKNCHWSGGRWPHLYVWLRITV